MIGISIPFTAAIMDWEKTKRKSKSSRILRAIGVFSLALILDVFIVVFLWSFFIGLYFVNVGYLVSLCYCFKPCRKLKRANANQVRGRGS